MKISLTLKIEYDRQLIDHIEMFNKNSNCDTLINRSRFFTAQGHIIDEIKGLLDIEQFELLDYKLIPNGENK